MPHPNWDHPRISRVEGSSFLKVIKNAVFSLNILIQSLEFVFLK
jgi:hypothetical protein